MSVLDRVEYRLMQSAAEREAIYKLRYRAYLNEGAIKPRSDQHLMDRFDYAANCWTFGIFLDDELCSSLRISVASPEMPVTPATEAFSDVLQPELARGFTIVDPNRFVADPDRQNKNSALPYLTLRLAYVACQHFDADLGTATVRKEHQAFYRRVFLHREIAKPRPYPTLIKPLSLMAVHFPSMREQVFARYPMFRSTPAERERLFGRRTSAPAISTPAPLIGSALAVC